MINSSLCYIERGGSFLMLHRVKKKQDPNEGKWIGVGGKFEENESPDRCMLREVYEETGLVPESWRCRGIVTFLSDRWEGEYMYLFTAESASGDPHECSEGDLRWVEKEDVPALQLWEGDRVFLSLLAKNAPFFLLTLRYEGDKLTEAVLNGDKLSLEEYL